MSVKPLIIPLLIVLVTLGVYTTTLATFPVNVADSNELMTAAYFRGIAHPPGYPLYSIILYLVMHFPWGDPAVNANLTSAICQSIGAALFYECAKHLIRRFRLNLSGGLTEVVSTSSALMLAFSVWYWDQATYAEVFGLQSVFTGLLLLLWLRDDHRRRPLLFFGLLGLALAHHQLTVLLVPLVGLGWGRRMALRQWIVNTAAAIAGFGVSYGWMLLTNRAAPLSWPFEPSPAGWWQLLSRSVYAPAGLAETMVQEVISGGIVNDVLTLMRHVAGHWGWALFGIVAGLGVLGTRGKRFGRTFIFCLLISGPLLAAYIQFPTVTLANDRLFFTGTYLRLRMFMVFEYLLALTLPLGWGWIASRLSGWPGKLLLVVLPTMLLATNYGAVNKRGLDFDQRFYTHTLTTLPEKAVVLVDSDAAFGLLYHQTVRGVRPDVLLIPTAMHMRWGYLKDKLPPEIFDITGYYRLILSLTQWGLGQNRPVVVVDPSDRLVQQLGAYKYALRPQGYQVRIGQEAEYVSDDYRLTQELINAQPRTTDLVGWGQKGEMALRHLTLAKIEAGSGRWQAAQTQLEWAEALQPKTVRTQQTIRAVSATLRQDD